VRVPAFEAVGDHIVAVLVRECLDEQLVRARQDGALVLDVEPVADVVRKARPLLAVVEECADPVGEVGRHRHARADIGGIRADLLVALT
jgi:hypothetical protein